MRFIYKVFGISVLLFVSYNIFLKIFPKLQNQVIAQNWWQENKIKAENFYHNKQSYDVILVGTSMSEGIILNQLKGKALTLNFIGGSTNTGLELIKLSSILPRILIIETNWLERSSNDQLITIVSNPNFDKIKHFVPSLLESNQLVNVFAFITKIKPTLIDTLKDKLNYSTNLKQNIISSNVDIDTIVMEKAIQETSNYIEYFKKKGVKIYLMELPIDSKLINTKRVSINKLVVKKYLGDLDTIPKFTKQTLATLDGYHFTTSSKNIYSNKLANFLNLQR